MPTTITSFSNPGMLLGRGVYAIPEAARILHTEPQTIRRWVSGYQRQSHGRIYTSPPLILSDVHRVDDEVILTFQDLIELLFISLFRKEGVSMQTIRAASEAAMRRFSSAHPFTVRRFQTDGTSIFATLEPKDAIGIPEEKFIEDLRLSQMVIEAAARPFFKQLDYGGEDVLRYWPLGQANRVVIDPARSMGKPIDSRSGVPTYVLYQMARKGESIKRIADWYEIDENGVVDAIEFESSLLKAA